MKQYKNLSGTSGVDSFLYDSTSIVITLKKGDAYLYSRESTSEEIIEKMKKLAEEGKGLETFMNDHVKKGFLKKLR